MDSNHRCLDVGQESLPLDHGIELPSWNPQFPCDLRFEFQKELLVQLPPNLSHLTLRVYPRRTLACYLQPGGRVTKSDVATGFPAPSMGGASAVAARPNHFVRIQPPFRCHMLDLFIVLPPQQSSR